MAHSAKGKAYRIPAEQIRRLVQGAGSCLVSDRILVDGCRVGYAYREPPDNALDSGWRFFAGDEEDAYCENAGNFGLHDVNTVANYDIDVLSILDAAIGSAFARNDAGVFVKER